MRKILFLLITIFSLFSEVHATGAPYYFIKNFTIDDYHASCQNWGFSLTSDGLLYVANNSGLLVFNGNSWLLYKTPDDLEINHVTHDNDTIYTQSKQQYYKWIYDSFGELVPHKIDSLPPSVGFEEKKTILPFTPDKQIADAEPSAYGFNGTYYFIGTRKQGLFILNRKGDILQNISMANHLQDNMVNAIDIQDPTQIWLALDNGITLITFNPSLFLLTKRSEVGKLTNASLNGRELYIETNQGYFECYLDSVFPLVFKEITQEKAEQFLRLNDSSQIDHMAEVFNANSSLMHYTHTDQIYPVGDNYYWLSSNNEAALFESENGNATLKCRLLFDNYGLNLITRGKKIFPLNDSLVLFSAMQGIVLVNTRNLIETGIINYTPLKIYTMSYWDNGEHYTLPVDQKKISLPHDFQEFEVEIGTTIFTLNHYISYKLEGISSEWSPWQENGTIRFLQIPEGHYDLKIRKYTVQGPFPELHLPIDVYPPWYNTFWAWVIYIALIWIAALYILRFNLKTLHKEDMQKAEEERVYEQQRVQALKNQMLETELQTKNNELILQTTALVKRNQSIQLLQDELEKQKEFLGDRYPLKLYQRMKTLMEETLNDQSDWIQFEHYFNSAHQHFMDRLRQEYSDLTPGDLRICCLLRMNLSTKEIASLLNVSIRAIEIRRYRLRKRMGLESDTNIVDFLIKF